MDSDKGNIPLQKKEAEEEFTLKRRLGLFNAVSILLSVTIGGGIFASPSTALYRAGSVGEALLVWAISGFISMLGALTYAELAAVVPRSGAEYSFLQAAYSGLHPLWGPLPSFLFIWVVTLILRPAEAAIIILVFAEYVYQLLSSWFLPVLCPETQIILKKFIALLSLGLTTYINTKNFNLFMKMQNTLSMCKVSICFLVVAGGVFNLCQGNIGYLRQGFEGSKTGIKDVILSIYSAMWSYDGWASVTGITEEIINPNKNILRSVLIAVPLVTVLFTMMNVAYLSVLSVPEMVTVPAVAVVFGDRVLGPLSAAIPLGVALATFSCSMASQFGVARLTFAGAREGHMPKVLSYIHVRRCIPSPAVVLQGVLTFLFILSGNIASLIEFASFLILIFYGLAFLALLVLRKTRPNVVRPFKVPTIIPVILVILSAVLAAVPVLMDPSFGHLGALLFMGLGVLVYVALVYCKIRLPHTDKLYYLVQLLMEVAPPQEYATDIL